MAQYFVITRKRCLKLVGCFIGFGWVLVRMSWLWTRCTSVLVVECGCVFGWYLFFFLYAPLIVVVCWMVLRRHWRRWPPRRYQNRNCSPMFIHHTQHTSAHLIPSYICMPGYTPVSQPLPFRMSMPKTLPWEKEYRNAKERFRIACMSWRMMPLHELGTSWFFGWPGWPSSPEARAREKRYFQNSYPCVSMCVWLWLTVGADSWRALSYAHCMRSTLRKWWREGDASQPTSQPTNRTKQTNQSATGQQQL